MPEPGGLAGSGTLAAPGGPPPPGAVAPRADLSPYQGGVRRGWSRALLVTSHRPGIVSLRPMSLGDVVDGAVKHLRRNAGPVFAASLVVLLVAAVPAILVAAVGARGSWYADLGGEQVIDQSGFFGLLLGFGFGFAALVLVGGLSYSVGEAVLGRRPRAAEMWTAVRGRLLPLVGLAALLTCALAVPTVVLVLLVALAVQSDSLLGAVLVGVGGGALVVVGQAVVLTRTCLAGPAVVLERRTVRHALRRSWALTRAVFWRTLVRLGVVGLLCLIVFWVVQLPLLLVASLVGTVLSLSPSLDALVSSLGVAVATLLSTAVVVPFAAGSVSLIYVDQRMRLEGFDLVLQRAARGASGTFS